MEFINDFGSKETLDLSAQNSKQMPKSLGEPSLRS